MFGAIDAFRSRNFMTKKTIVYAERESKTLEFKSILPDFGKLIKTCIAFANGVGGEL